MEKSEQYNGMLYYYVTDKTPFIFRGSTMCHIQSKGNQSMTPSGQDENFLPCSIFLSYFDLPPRFSVWLGCFCSDFCLFRLGFLFAWVWCWFCLGFFVAVQGFMLCLPIMINVMLKLHYSYECLCLMGGQKTAASFPTANCLQSDLP